MLKRIIKSANITKKDVVFEIGAGQGQLTKYLVRVAKKVVVCEKDDLMIPYLKQYGVRIIHKDFMKVRIPGNTTIIIGNIPYYLSSVITEKVLKEGRRAVIMFQKEFAKRLVARPGTRDYSRITVLAQTLSVPTILFSVNRHNFKPVPKTDSVVVSFAPKNEEYDEEFFSFVRLAFQHRNKSLKNSLISSRLWDKTKKELKTLLEKVSSEKVRFMSVERLKQQYLIVKKIK